jgi:hypothetical protein
MQFYVNVLFLLREFRCSWPSRLEFRGHFRLCHNLVAVYQDISQFGIEGEGVMFLQIAANPRPYYRLQCNNSESSVMQLIMFRCTRNISMTLLFESDFSLIVKIVGGKYLRCVFMGWIILIFKPNMSCLLQ